ncbi:hypothetical protein [Nonomuraea sediminis]|uniref:hypothetical protein n=1 Tax=Nonomuraea sediminis TaxID=2835864 RepID=UPI001BDD2924|nr:hypothetical protein [Nonomuraea sediminis]
MRHLIGTAAGLVALPLVYYLTEAGARALRVAYTAFDPGTAGLACLAGAAAIVTVVSLSPVAALACGLPLAMAGALFTLVPDYAAGLAARLPQVGALPGEPAGTLAGVGGLYGVIGFVLVFSALLPGRLRTILGG